MGQMMRPIHIKDLPIGDLVSPTKWLGEVALFSLLGATLLLDYCADNGIDVLGIEGFRLEGGKRIPDANVITDFSELMSILVASFPQRSVAAIRNFLKLLPQDDVMLEFVLVEPIG